MSSLDLDLDAQINNLEVEWRAAYDASTAARAEYKALAASRSTRVDALDVARERLERTESKRSCVMTKIERLEESMLRKQGMLRTQSTLGTRSMLRKR
jgi:hypothetical protein